MNNPECRFLIPDGQCVIGRIVQPRKFIEVKVDEPILGAVAWTSFTIARLIPSCSVKDNPGEQKNCDCFVPKQQLDNSEFLENFQEG